MCLLALVTPDLISFDADQVRSDKCQLTHQEVSGKSCDPNTLKDLNTFMQQHGLRIIVAHFILLIL